MQKKLTIKEACEIVGVADETLRLWEKQGKITPSYTKGGHRRYNRIDIEKLAGTYVEPEKERPTNRVAIYCRVSSHEQKTKGDLERQIGRVTKEAVKRKYNVIEIFEEVGSGMNDNRAKLQKLFKLVESKEIDEYTDLNGSLEMMQKRIAEWITRYGPDAILSVGMEWDTLLVHIQYTRLETDDEYTKRIDKAKKAKLSKQASRERSKAQQQADELKLYEQLKKKYG